MIETSRKRLASLYEVQVEVLSPLHIGSGGAPLMPNLDYYEAEDRVVVVDPNAVVAELEEEVLQRLSDEFNLSTLVRLLYERGGADALARVARYTLPLLPEAGEIVPQLKDAFGNPYLPGSSLKGAWRTALAWALWTDDPVLGAKAARRYRVLAFREQIVAPVFRALDAGKPVDWHKLVRETFNPNENETEEYVYAAKDVFAAAVDKLQKDKPFLSKRGQWNDREVSKRLKVQDKFADDSIERLLFGRDPNFDALRVVQVSDSNAVEATTLLLGRAAVYAKRPDGKMEEQSPIFLEYLPAGTKFTLTLKLDRFLAGVPAGMPRDDKPRNVASHLRSRALTVASEEAIVNACRRFAAQVLDAEMRFFADVGGLAAVRGAYERLRSQMASLREHECLVPLAWGTGWTSKTLGTLLKTDENTFHALWAQYWGSRNRPQLIGDFPTSCKLLKLADGSLAPLGWVKVTFLPTDAPVHLTTPARTAVAAIPLPSATPAGKAGTAGTLPEQAVVHPKKQAKPKPAQPPKKKQDAGEKARRQQEEIMRRMREGH